MAQKWNILPFFFTCYQRVDRIKNVWFFPKLEFCKEICDQNGTLMESFLRLRTLHWKGLVVFAFWYHSSGQRLPEAQKFWMVTEVRNQLQGMDLNR